MNVISEYLCVTVGLMVRLSHLCVNTQYFVYNTACAVCFLFINDFFLLAAKKLILALGVFCLFFKTQSLSDIRLDRHLLPRWLGSLGSR